MGFASKEFSLNHFLGISDSFASVFSIYAVVIPAIDKTIIICVVKNTAICFHEKYVINENIESRGPSMDPWGTPLLIWRQSLLLEPTLSLW